MFKVLGYLKVVNVFRPEGLGVGLTGLDFKAWRSGCRMSGSMRSSFHFLFHYPYINNRKYGSFHFLFQYPYRTFAICCLQGFRESTELETPTLILQDSSLLSMPFLEEL